MDGDLDFTDNDKIQIFLKEKLAEIRQKNERLQQKLLERQKHTNVSVENGGFSMDEIEMKINREVWKKIFNNKLIIGYSLENKSSSSFENVKLILQWSSKSPLLYKTFIFEELDLNEGPQHFSCKQNNCTNISDELRISTHIIHHKAHLLVVLDVPQFIDALEYVVTSYVVYNNDSTNKSNNALCLPVVTVTNDDLTNHEIFVSPLYSNIQDLLSIIGSSKKTEFMMILPKMWSSTLNNTFEIHCSLNKINISCMCKMYFISHAVSPLFDKTMLELHIDEQKDNQHFLSIYSSSESSLLFFLHHLHKSIPGSTIFPLQYAMYYERQKENSPVSELKDLNQCLNKEIKFVHNFLEETVVHHATSDRISHFRSELADLEHQTDLAYATIEKGNEDQ